MGASSGQQARWQSAALAFPIGDGLTKDRKAKRPVIIEAAPGIEPFQRSRRFRPSLRPSHPSRTLTGVGS